MASLDDLISQIPIGQIAQQLGVDEKTASTAVQAALPTLVGGLQANAQDPAGAASLLSALGNHGNLLDGGVDVNQVDTDDGRKIVNNVFGGSTDQVVSTLGGGIGNNDLVKQLLPILAPIVLAYVAKQLGVNAGNTAGASPAPQQGGAGGALGSILGGILSGSGGGGGGLGNVLGSVLGGNAGGAIGDVLGGLLGGGKR